MTGRVADIKRLAVHDGPGIRTTMFLKGCPLRCLWCHNPENMSLRPALAYTKRLCHRCGACAGVCPSGAISVEGGPRIESGLCRGCGVCAEACLHGALRLYGREMSALNAAAMLLLDEGFYRASGGGVTLSGGEPLLQAEFCAEVLGCLREQGVHTAVDTCGEVPWAAFEAVLPETNLFLYDVKDTDSARHERYTGTPNTRILDNLRRLDRQGAAMEIRMPIVPGVNDGEDALDDAGRLFAGLHTAPAVRLLPYHGMSSGEIGRAHV